MSGYSTVGIIQRVSTTMQNGMAAIELVNSEHANGHTLIIDISSPSSLTSGTLALQMLNPNTDTWVACPQNISINAAGGTAPSGANGNTASTTLLVGSSVTNTIGLTAVTNTLTAFFSTDVMGCRLRIAPGAASGTATLKIAYIPARLLC